MANYGPNNPPPFEDREGPLPRKTTPKLVIYPHRTAVTRRRRFGFRLIAGNGEQVASSQGYLSRREARNRGLYVANGAYRDPKVVEA